MEKKMKISLANFSIKMKLFFQKSRNNISKMLSYEEICYLINIFTIWKSNSKNS